MHRRPCLSLAAVVSMLLATASSGFALPSTVCDLMTQQQAATVFGSAVAPGRVEMGTASLSGCRFDTPKGDFAEIGVMDAKAWGMPAAALFKTLAEPSPGHTVESIAGLGESAILVKGPTDSTLSVLYHDKILLVSATGSKNPGLRAALIDAARQALGKI